MVNQTSPELEECLDHLARGAATGSGVDGLLERKVIASDSPYAVSYARLTPGVLNTPEDVDRAIAEVKVIAAA